VDGAASTSEKGSDMAASSHAIAARLWLVILLRGLLVVALGVLALFWPSVAVTTVFAVFGLFSVVDGVLMLATGIVFRRTGWGWSLLSGLLSVGVGAFALAFPQGAANLVVMIIAGWATAAGAIALVMAVRLRRVRQSSWGWVSVSGITTGLVGVFFLANPTVGAAFLGAAVGLLATVFGLVLLFGAYRLYRTQAELLRLFA
jgi:uncharacterized membrane protein HdeD (DUF308 family)